LKLTIGSPEIGELAITKFGDLTPNKRKYLREQSKSLPDFKRAFLDEGIKDTG